MTLSHVAAGDPHVASHNAERDAINALEESADDLASSLATVATTGVYGDLSGKPTLGNAASKNVGTAAGTVAAGDDSRITGAVQASALGTAAAANIGTASGDVPVLGSGGRLPMARIATGTPDGTKFVRDDGSLAVPPGGGGGSGTGDVVGPGAAVDGNIPAFVGTTGKVLGDSGVALGNAASKNVGTAAGTVAAGNDARFGDAAALAASLSTVATTGVYGDLSGKPTLGNAASKNVGDTVGTVAAGDDPRFAGIGGGGYDPLAYKGAYNPASNYAEGDTVRANNKVYIAKTAAAGGTHGTGKTPSLVYKNSAGSASTGVANVGLTIPSATLLEGDLVMVMVSGSDASPNTMAGSGWSQWLSLSDDTNSRGHRLFVKYVTAAEAGATLACTFTEVQYGGDMSVRVYRDTQIAPAVLNTTYRFAIGGPGVTSAQSVAASAVNVAPAAGVEVSYLSHSNFATSGTSVNTTSGAQNTQDGVMAPYISSSTGSYWLGSHDRVISAGDSWTALTATLLSGYANYLQVRLVGANGFTLDPAFWDEVPFLTNLMHSFGGGENVLASLTTTGNVAVDLALYAAFHTPTLTGAVTPAFSNPPVSGKLFTYQGEFTWGASPATHLINLPANGFWLGTAPVPVALKKCFVTYQTRDGGLTWACSWAIQG